MQESSKALSSNKASSQVLVGIQKVIEAFSSQGIAKSHKNEQQGFAYRGIDDVLNRMAHHLVEANLVIVPRVLSREVQERLNSRGNPLIYVTLTVEYSIMSTVDGSSVQCVTVGEAMDSGDKATNKAMSAAYKYAAFQAFSIPTEGDNDAD
jgi:broad-specificity NMP kinase